jgi:hypothetical protein
MRPLCSSDSDPSLPPDPAADRERLRLERKGAVAALAEEALLQLPTHLVARIRLWQPRRP